MRQDLATFCDQQSYAFLSRPKSVGSLSEKLEGGRYKSWSDIDDRFACTVVVPTTEHEQSVVDFTAFKRKELRRRNSTIKAPDVFRFDSTRWVGSLPDSAVDNLPPGAGGVYFEVQIPTVFEHAWTVVTHDLVYKSGEIDWRRSRLASQLKASVEQAELLIAGFQQNINFVAQSKFPEVDQTARLVKDVKEVIQSGILARDLAPESWSRFAQNVLALVGSYEDSRAKTPKALDALRKSFLLRLESDREFADFRAGSLFQLVVSHIASGAVPRANLDNFVIVNSSEFRSMLGVTAIPKPFLFDHAVGL